jgi:MtrB/PioB family decaheme-associated outer membrane protein
MRTDRLAFVMIAACAVALCASARPAMAEGSLVLGSQWWTQTADDAKYQEFRDVARGPFVESLTYGQMNGRNTYVLSAVNAAQGDQAWKGMWAWGSKLNVRVGYIETPHRFSLISKSPFTEVSPGVFVLPDSLQALMQRSSTTQQTNIINNLMASAGRLPLEFQTHVSTARVRVRPKAGWTFEANGRQTSRAGRKAYGAFIGTSPGNPMVELAEPIDQTMTDADVRANYSDARMTVQAVGSMSTFDNHHEALRWDNLRRVTDLASGTGAGPARGQLALAPDNTEVRGSIAVGVKLPKKHVFSGTVAVAQISQDQDWLPVTINAALRPDTLVMPGTNTDGKATVVNLDARLTSMAMDHLRGTVRFHSDKYDNQTPEWTFNRTVNGDVAVVGPFSTKPFGNDNWVAGLDLDTDVNPRVSVGVTAEYRTRNRTHREIDKDKETVFGGRARVRPMDGLSLDGKVRYGTRELDSFLEEDYESAPGVWMEQPELRRYDVANRKQLLAQGGLSWMPMEKLDLAVNYTHLSNEYPDQEFGLTDEKSGVFSGQGTFHATPKLDLRGGYGFSQIKAKQESKQGLGAGIMTDALSDSLRWSLDQTDENVFVSAGFEFWVTPQKFSIVGDYEFSRDFVTFDLWAAPGFYSAGLAASNRFGGDVPNTLYRRHDVVLEARYQLMKSTQITGRYGWQEFDAIDFAAKDLALVAPSAAAVYLGDFYQDYRAHRVALLLKHTF